MDSRKLVNALSMMMISFIGWIISNVYLYILQQAFNTHIINYVVEISIVIFYSIIILLLLGGIGEHIMIHKELMKK